MLMWGSTMYQSLLQTRWHQLIRKERLSEATWAKIVCWGKRLTCQLDGCNSIEGLILLNSSIVGRKFSKVLPR